MSSRFTYPFCYRPRPEIVEAAARLISRIDSDPELRRRFCEGKMLGVMMVGAFLNGQRVFDFIYAFSGLAGGESTVPGFVPPIFDTTSADIDSSSPEESRQLQEWLFRQYRVLNGLGEESNIAEIFASQGIVPPGGTGDCAGPKLLQYAYSHHLKPVAMGEFWYGRQPAGEVRRQGSFYPSCTGKCGPLLEWMMQGLDMEPNPLEGEALWSIEEPTVLFEDESLVVADKPSGMLAVPGRTEKRCLQEWLKQVCGCEIFACHRLDMDTSGLMVFAKSAETQAAIQRQFEEREVRKTYLARLCPAKAADVTIEAARGASVVEAADASRAAGEDLAPVLAAGDTGTIKLPLYPDYYDRPRQMVDFEKGRMAVTKYEVLKVLPDGSVDVRFTPLTGRTHQLRVHAAHKSGLGRPIAGDRLYGGQLGSVQRLMLHADTLSFRHPITFSRLSFSSDHNRITWGKSDIFDSAAAG